MQQGFNLPIIPILILIISVLTYFLGWVVLAISAGLFICIPVITAVYDRLTHGSNCIECNTIKQAISDEMGIEIDTIKTKHEKIFDDHIHIRADIGKEKTILFDISIGGQSFQIIQRENDSKKNNLEPIQTVEEAIHCIESFDGRPEDFKLPVSDQLQDPSGINMAIITDSILKKSWRPDGFEQKAGYRIYKYMNLE